MAKEYSFDISAKIDMQSFKNAINLVDKEVANRYDFKGTTGGINNKTGQVPLNKDNPTEDSLNVSAATAIIVFEAVRQRLQNRRENQ